MIRESKTPSRPQTVVSLVIFLALMGIAAGIFLAQYRFNPAVLPKEAFLPAEGGNRTAVSPPESTSLIPLPRGLIPMSAPETFDTHNLSDKINGKAELYLSAGFIRLTSQRFSLEGASGLWIETFIYDMGSVQNAFSVFSAQRRMDSEPLDMAQYAYRTPNAFFLAQGPYYLEIIASAASAQAGAPMQKLAENFIRENPMETTAVGETELFPTQELVANSITLIATDAFGYDRFNQIYTAEYKSGGSRLTAYLSRRGTSQEAQELARAYREFLIAFGGQPVAAELPIKNAQVTEILESYEVVFSHGPFLAGVREAASLEGAKEMASRLYQRLKEVYGDF